MDPRQLYPLKADSGQGYAFNSAPPRWPKMFHDDFQTANPATLCFTAGKIIVYGTFTMLMGDLCSLRQLGAPVKIVIFRNDSLAFVELEMKAAGIVDFGTDLRNPSFARMAEAAGVLGLTAETSDQVRPMIAQALAHNGPALVEVPVSRQELSMPPTINLEEARGFGLFALRAVLAGRGDEIVDLAKVNLFR
jgi:pyruvate dehydrogenase (quinone)